MLVNVVGGVLVTQMLAQNRVVQTACLGRRTFLAAQGPAIGAVLSLVLCNLIFEYVFHCQLEALFVSFLREL